MYKNQKGFTLIELSIVVVVIALIVAGVVAGQSLVKQAKLRSVVNDFNKYKTAYNSFYLQYGGIPGDMTNAYDFWGDEGAVCADTRINVGGCNGDGDGYIGYGLKPANPIYLYAYSRDEEYKLWQFLALSGHIKGSYDGIRNADYKPGINVPTAPIGGATAVYRFGYGNKYERWTTPTNLNSNNIKGNNFLELAKVGSINTRVTVSILTTAEAKNIDSKIDDSLPHTGKLLGSTGSVMSGTVPAHCADLMTGNNEYILGSGDVVSCIIYLKMDK